MILRRVFSLLIVAALGVGCMNVSTTLSVRPDGSGTVTERLVVSPQFAQMMQKMKRMGDSTAASGGLFTEEDIRKDASSLGMRLESVQMISGAEGEGYEAVYRFDNLNEVRFDPSPDDVLPNQASQQTNENLFELLSEMDVSYTSGSPATLTIGMPHQESADEANTTDDSLSMDAPGEDQTSPQARKMMRAMMKDAGLRLDVTVEGEIIETNATHRSGSTITLLNMDFGQVAQDSTAFNRVMTNDESSVSPQAAVDSFNTLPGISIEPQKTVTIRFR